jgi:hypothetical protein
LQCPKIQQLHINFKPDDEADAAAGKKNVDRWHCDSTPFVLIVFATNPDEYTGGQLQYFNGAREEGVQLLRSGAGLTADRVLDVGRQELGYSVFMQGWRVFHQVTPVLSGDARTTVVYSFQPRNVLALEACLHLSQTYNKVDPLHIFLSDWARYRAWKTARRCEICAENLAPLLQENVDLQSVVTKCRESMASIVSTLPYTDDRGHMQAVLEGAVAALRTFLLAAQTNGAQLSPAFAQSPYGLNNLQGAVTDIDDCVQDILTLQDSSMEYY